jgi:hypothetical protein
VAGLTFRTARRLLAPGDVVFILLSGRIVPAQVLEICDGWIETTAAVLDFEEVGDTWFLTEIIAKEKSRYIPVEGYIT